MQEARRRVYSNYLDEERDGKAIKERVAWM